MATVFVSYRREDAAPWAGRICDRLGAAFGADHVFMDVQDIPAGADFVDAIDKTVAACDVLIAVIGPSWLETLRARGAEGHDFVEHEIAAALRRGIAVIPVLTGGSAMPEARELPPQLSALARRNALVIRDDVFDQDAGGLVRAVRHAAGPEKSSRRLVWLLVAAGFVIAIAATAVFLSQSRDRASLNGEWIARMQRAGSRPYTLRLRLETSGRTLTGQVEYPTGGAAIQGGTFDQGRVAFFTRHIPQFESEPATIVFSGEVRGPELALTATTPDGTVTTGIARKRQ